MKRRFLLSCFFLLTVVASIGVQAETFVSIEGASAWQSRNDQRIPGDTGTDFSIADFGKGPLPAYRIYVGHIWNKRHELRALYAPFETELTGRFARSIIFLGTTFASGVDTQAFYKFNSYRLTYAYHFDKVGEWEWALGFTGKIRDAEVRLTQGALRESKSNIGFVPLLNFQALRTLSASWLFRFDVDGLAAPQGRAIDAALLFEYLFAGPNGRVLAGYRTVEGGADNKEVYNFAWVHYATLGLRGEF